MKTCPVCKARAFDDAQVCYGCLHKFSQQETANYQVFSPTSHAMGVNDSAKANGLHPVETARVPAVRMQECEEASAVGKTLVRQNVSVPGRDADIVVRIEFVEPAKGQSSPGSVNVEVSPECNLLRRGRPARVIDNARPAEAGRVVSAGQVGARGQEGRARHAAVAAAEPYAEAEIA